MASNPEDKESEVAVKEKKTDYHVEVVLPTPQVIAVSILSSVVSALTVRLIDHLSGNNKKKEQRKEAAYEIVAAEGDIHITLSKDLTERLGKEKVITANPEKKETLETGVKKSQESPEVSE